ncbi:virulence RhuM family protein [Candidatus Uhrbacteria bacterium]|nr:virulence RhuM family protein [Candidatus Uhrbacteria bacterium]
MKKIPDNQIAFYQSPEGSVHIEVLYAEENIWLSQKKIAELFDTTTQNITQHLKNVYTESELDEAATCKDFLQVQDEGGRTIERKIKMYSLEAIIAIGYRVNSERGTQFRQWATGILKSYIHKGYVLDSDRMKYGSRFSARYFDELYEEIKDIRTSERMIYQKITDIYATAIDYSPKAYESKQFFATVQNKLHFAITGKTAAEIIAERVSSKKEKMGLTSWRRSPHGKIMPSDAVIAKNYLVGKEVKHLNRIGNMYLDYAEMQTARGRAMTMKDWVEKLNAFLKFSEYEILSNAGKVSHEVAESLALKEYEKYRVIQDKNYVSDFDREVKKLLDGKKKESKFKKKEKERRINKIGG